jgi:RNA polymerase sigma-70 factor (ECF subfamily)
MREDWTDERLLEAARGGDRAAFEIFYTRHLPGVVALCRRMTGSRETAADLTAEVFAALVQSLPRYRARRGPAAAWLYGIARNKGRESLRRGRVEDRARRRLRLERIELDDDDLARVDELTAAGDRALVAVAGLPADQRDAVLGRVVDEREYAELAATLRCSEAVVRQRVSRGLAQVRGRLEADG